MTPICVLRTSRDFGSRHVQWLARQVPGLVCLGDQAVDGVPTIPLQYDWPRWWPKLELFRPDIEGDLLYFDLDTVVLGDISALDVGQTTMLSDFYRPERPASGLMYISQADKARVWQAFTADPERHMARCTSGDRWGDQGFLSEVLSPARWQDLRPGKVISYKAHVRKGVNPMSADVICFHGQPRPWEVRAGWVPSL